MFNLDNVHSSWLPIVEASLSQVHSHYIQELAKNPNWLPGHKHIFNAFSLPLPDTHFILFGESPYPRAQSAIGYAFWDGAVNELWSENGLAKAVNRATSLRNIMKMLLVAENLLTPEDTSQPAIVSVDKSQLVQTLNQLFGNLLNHGFLLLNASLALGNNYSVKQHAKMWQPFVASILAHLAVEKPDIQLILLGNIAKVIKNIPLANEFSQITAEHPYNISFITNPKVLNFFKSFHLLKKEKLQYNQNNTIN